MQRPTARRHGIMQGKIFTLQDVKRVDNVRVLQSVCSCDQDSNGSRVGMLQSHGQHNCQFWWGRSVELECNHHRRLKTSKRHTTLDSTTRAVPMSTITLDKVSAERSVRRVLSCLVQARLPLHRGARKHNVWPRQIAKHGQQRHQPYCAAPNRRRHVDDSAEPSKVRQPLRSANFWYLAPVQNSLSKDGFFTALFQPTNPPGRINTPAYLNVLSPLGAPGERSWPGPTLH